MATASVLGESWVVASSPSPKAKQQKKNSSRASGQRHQLAPEDEDNHGFESISASTSSMSGPELIMPSIYEAPISEGSWIAPTVRAKQTSANLRQRHREPSSKGTETEKKNNISGTPTPGSGSPTPSQGLAQSRGRLFSLEASLRTLANIILLAAIAHLLVLPELVQQYQTLCTIGPISALYPSSCIPLFPQPVNHNSHSDRQRQPSTRFEAVVSSQTRLEALFNATLHTMSPLTSSLKQTESHLRDVERELKRAHPGTKHELDLEFASCWQAIRIAAWKFDSLKADLQSAFDSLVAAGEVAKTTTDPRSSSSSSSSSVAQDARLATQTARREQYLTQLTARMRSKADSLAADLATLEDHLESIEGIVERESTHSRSAPIYQLPHDLSGASQNPSSRFRAFVNAILPAGVRTPVLSPSSSSSSPLNRDEQKAEESNHPPQKSLAQLFHEATSYHRPVAKMALTLSEQLRPGWRD